MKTNTLYRSTVLMGVLLVGGASTALADDLFPPPWRGNPGTTMQEWGFNPSNPTAPDQANNPFGQPQFIPGTGATYTITAPGATSTGWWVVAPGASVTFIIPNANQPTHSKEVYIQLVFMGAVDPSVADPSGNPFASNSTTTIQPAPGGGNYQSFDFIFPVCPPFEIVTLHNPSPQNPLYIGQVVIDTYCVPTPGAAAVVGIGMLAATRRRRI